MQHRMIVQIKQNIRRPNQRLGYAVGKIIQLKRHIQHAPTEPAETFFPQHRRPLVRQKFPIIAIAYAACRIFTLPVPVIARCYLAEG